MSHNWCRPDLADTPGLDVAGGRHPVVEAALAKAGERFVPNDVSLCGSDRLWLVTGPNMGGKSTFLRQNALIVVLAQAGRSCPPRPRDLALSTDCSAASGRATTSRAGARRSEERRVGKEGVSRGSTRRSPTH